MDKENLFKIATNASTGETTVVPISDEEYEQLLKDKEESANNPTEEIDRIAILESKIEQLESLIAQLTGGG